MSCMVVYRMFLFTRFGSKVSCKWTRQLHHRKSINSSVGLNWGLFRHSISYMASLWRRNTTDTPTLHRINNVIVNFLRVSETFQRRLSSAVTKNWPPLKFTGKNELTNSLLKKLEFIWPIRQWFQFCLFPRAAIKQFINWPINKMFWNTVRSLPFFSACKSGVNKVFKTFDKNFMGFTSIIFVGESQNVPR